MVTFDQRLGVQGGKWGGTACGQEEQQGRPLQRWGEQGLSEELTPPAASRKGRREGWCVRPGGWPEAGVEVETLLRSPAQPGGTCEGGGGAGGAGVSGGGARRQLRCRPEHSKGESKSSRPSHVIPRLGQGSVFPDRIVTAPGGGVSSPCSRSTDEKPEARRGWAKVTRP